MCRMDEVSDAAERFAHHCATCAICSLPDDALCVMGEQMVRVFQDALNASSPNFDRNVN